MATKRTAQPQYSDLPPGATVYSDLPAGATIVQHGTGAGGSSYDPAADAAEAAASPAIPAHPSASPVHSIGSGVLDVATDNFSRNTRHVPTTGVESTLQNFGAGAGDAIRSLRSGPRPSHAPTAKEKIGAAVQSAQDFIHDPIAGTASTLGEGAAQLIGGELTARGASAAADAGSSTLSAARTFGERYTGYDSPAIPARDQAAARLAASVRPPGGVKPAFEQNLGAQIPSIKSYAAETGNPLHSQWEGATAARELADKNLAHFNDNILGPNSDISVGQPDFGPTYRGEGTFKDNQGRPIQATLGQINKRISDINDLTRAANNANTTGAAMTALERQGLEAEGSQLRNLLYNKLGEASGIAPDDIRSLRESYGQLYNVADTLDAARRARLGRTAVAEEGEAGINVPHSKSGVMRELVDKLRGSHANEYKANQAWREGLDAFDSDGFKTPQPVYPQPKRGGASVRAPR